jgi:hypothetical protein
MHRLLVCREVQYERGPDGKPRVTSLLLAKARQQQLVTSRRSFLCLLLFCLQAGAV